MNILFFVMIIFPQLLFAQTQTVTLLEADKGQQVLVSEVSVLVDESGTKTLSNIIGDKSEFEPLEKEFAVGYTSAAHWFQILLQRTGDAPTEWVLKVDPGIINNLRFYSKNTVGDFVMQQAGDMYVNLSRPIDKQFGAYSFKVFLPDTSVQEVYFRFQTRSTSLFSFSIATPEIRTQNNTKNKLVLGILIGILCMFFIATLLTAQRSNYIVHIISAGHILTGIMLLMTLDGLLAQFLLFDSPKTNSYLTQVAACLLVILPILFIIVFFQYTKRAPSIYFDALWRYCLRISGTIKLTFWALYFNCASDDTFFFNGVTSSALYMLER